MCVGVQSDVGWHRTRGRGDANALRLGTSKLIDLYAWTPPWYLGRTANVVSHV